MKNIQDVRENVIAKGGNLYLDFTASGLAYQPIEDKVQEILKTYANVHSEFGEHAQSTAKYYADARNSLYKNLGVNPEDFYILPAGTGSTGAIKKFQEITGLYIPPESRKRLRFSELQKPLVIVGPYEHHSNEISYRESLADTIRVPLKDHAIDMDFLENVLKENKGREMYGSFSAASNVTGVKTNMKQISELLRRYDAYVCIDAASFSPYANVDSSLYDALFLSPHKLIGGVASSGLLVVSKKFFGENYTPTFAGGGTVDYVSKDSQVYLSDVHDAENAGTPGIIQLVRAAEAYTLRNEIGLELIEKKEEELKEYFFKRITEVEGAVLYEKDNKDRLSIFSFNIDGFDHHFLSQQLSEKYNIQTRSGCSCTGPYGHDLLNIEGKFDYKNEKKPG